MNEILSWRVHYREGENERPLVFDRGGRARLLASGCGRFLAEAGKITFTPASVVDRGVADSLADFAAGRS